MTEIVKYCYNGNTYDTETPAQEAATQRLSVFHEEIREACSISIVVPCHKKENSWVVSGKIFDENIQNLLDNDPRNFNFTSFISGKTCIGVSARELKTLYKELYEEFVVHYEPSQIIKSITNVGEDGLVTEQGFVLNTINTIAEFSFKEKVND